MSRREPANSDQCRSADSLQRLAPDFLALRGADCIRAAATACNTIGAANDNDYHYLLHRGLDDLTPCYQNTAPGAIMSKRNENKRRTALLLHRPNTTEGTMKTTAQAPRFGWTHEKMMAAHALRKTGLPCKTAARMALRGWTIVRRAPVAA